MNEFSQSLQELPLAGLVPVGLMVLVGLLLWAAGRRLLRPGVAAAGLLVGAIAGWIVGENVNVGVVPIVPALVVGIILAAVAVLACRLAVAVALAIVLAVAAPLAVLAVNELQGGSMQASQHEHQEPDEPQSSSEISGAEENSTDSLDRWLNDRAAEHLPEGADPNLSSEELARQFGMSDDVSQHIGTVNTWAEAAIEAIRELYNNTPQHLRMPMIAAGIGGFVLGLLIGALTPGLSASVVTAFGGGLLWLTGVRIISERVVEGSIMPETGRGWLVLWIVISCIGLAIQWMFRPKRADKSER